MFERYGRAKPQPSGGAAIAVCLAALMGVTAEAARAARQDPGGKASAPPATSTTGTNTIRRNVQVVEVPVTVLDKRGIPVIDLAQNDFQVFEDGQRQTIRYFRREPAPPLMIGLILDTSNAMRQQMQFEKDAASDFVFNMLQSTNAHNQIFLQTFDQSSSILQDFTDDPQALNDKIRGLKAGGGKSLYDAIYFACRHKMLAAGSPEQTRRVLVLISDGLDLQSTHTLAETLSMSHRAETAIYTIGNSPYGYDNPADKILRRLAEDTGGAAFFPLEKEPGADLATGYLSHGQIGDTSQNKGLGAETGIYDAERMIHLADALGSIEHELGNQYFIGYTPTRTVLDGTYRTIHVVVDRRGVTVRNKPGYFAIAQPPAPPPAGAKTGN